MMAPCSLKMVMENVKAGLRDWHYYLCCYQGYPRSRAFYLHIPLRGLGGSLVCHFPIRDRFRVYNNLYKYFRVSYARRRRKRIKPGAAPQVHIHQTIYALQAQK